MSARILIVDDIPANVKLLEAKLEAEYYQVLTADSGPRALAVAAEEVPDAVLLDVMMPEMDGFEVCRRLKAEAATRHIPVVMITALNEVADRVRGLEAGADDFLSKPVDDVALFARLRSLLRVKLMLDELRGRQATSDELGILAAEPDVDPAAAPARVLLVEGDAFATRRIGGVLEEGGHAVEALAEAEAALARVAEGAFELAIIGAPAGGADGLRLCSQLRSQEATRHLPLVLVLDDMDAGRVSKALDLGVSDYLVEPVDRGELLARTRTQVRRQRTHERLRAALDDSVAMALTDPGTGLYNRRYLMAHLERKIVDLAAAGKALSVAVIDIDRFKAINDGHGHAAGDAVLAALARRIADELRSIDLVARYGGEEFVAVLPAAEAEAARSIAERLRRRVAGAPFALAEARASVAVTISLGLATTRDAEETAEALLARADAALYRAKAAGRDRVAADADEPPRRAAAGG